MYIDISVGRKEYKSVVTLHRINHWHAVIRYQRVYVNKM